MLRKIHKYIGKLIYRYTKEPISTKLKPQYNKDMIATHIVRRVLGLHYYE